MSKYTVTLEIEAGSLTEAWDKIRFFPANLTSDECNRALDHGHHLFRLQNNELVDGREQKLEAKFYPISDASPVEASGYPEMKA